MILDTNAVSALADGSIPFANAIANVEQLALPVVTLGEFRYGIGRSRFKKRYEKWLVDLVSVCRVLVIDEDTSVRYALLREQLRQRGRPIPSNDAWIAALALQHDLAVLSRDAHFDEVAGVRRIDW